MPYTTLFEIKIGDMDIDYTLTSSIFIKHEMYYSTNNNLSYIYLINPTPISKEIETKNKIITNKHFQ